MQELMQRTCYTVNKKQVDKMRTFTHNYPSDITREQYEVIREELEYTKKKTKPREIDLFSVFCAILYLIKGGIQWDMIPSDFPDRSIVRYYYDKWSRPKRDGTTTLAVVLKKLVVVHRNGELRKDKTSLGIVDAQSVQNADTAEEKGYDAGKKKQESSDISL